jgi:uncharacterized membrane protein (UPF0127 family)
MWIATLISAFLYIGGEELEVEVADTPSLRNRGLMHRDSLDPGHGMLFVYPEPETLSFWMKNTRIPLSVGFFDEEKRLQQIENMDPPKTDASPLRLYKSSRPMQYALEVPQNWFKEHKISLGEKFTLQDFEKTVK